MNIIENTKLPRRNSRNPTSFPSLPSSFRPSLRTELMCRQSQQQNMERHKVAFQSQMSLQPYDPTTYFYNKFGSSFNQLQAPLTHTDLYRRECSQQQPQVILQHNCLALFHHHKSQSCHFDFVMAVWLPRESRLQSIINRFAWTLWLEFELLDEAN